MVKHLACYLTDHKQKSINSSWLEIALWPQIWSLAPLILNAFTQIHHVFINEAIDTKTMLFNIGHRQIWMGGVNQCQYSPRHLDLLFEQLWRHSTWATPPPVVGCSAALAHPQHLDQPRPGLHNSFNPAIQDGSMWSKFGARGEHGVVFLFSNLGVLWFSENRALCSCLNKYIHCMFV